MVKCNLQGKNVEVYISGNLDTKDALELRKGITDYLNQGARNISVNLKELKEIDSTGLGVLVAANKLANKNNGKVSIDGASGNVKEMFKLTRLDRVFEI
ncbi:MAG: STAS domain-containing protein [Tissierellia bacterium]|nr:STAS domain-containing protein [Tissierellia bacterium]